LYKKNIELKRKTTCTVCKGSKAKPGSKPQKCGTCHGMGVLTFQQGIMLIKT
jgi:molecular chaperone DnaJ